MSQGTGLPLILAVEADERQAAELTSLFQTEVSAELVLAGSAQQALAAVGNRIPDLVLTSQLIPPKDEAALTAWLRTLGDKAAHVQTVTIPALATSKTAPSDPPFQRRTAATGQCSPTTSRSTSTSPPANADPRSHRALRGRVTLPVSTRPPGFEDDKSLRSAHRSFLPHQPGRHRWR
jgi:hypothetical protein